jgi:hypothetical protein
MNEALLAFLRSLRHDNWRLTRDAAYVAAVLAFPYLTDEEIDEAIEVVL